METFNLKVISPQDLLFEGQIVSLSSKNSSGNFDVLAEHADFVSIIENQPIVIRTASNQKQTFKFTLAIIYTTKNNVIIYAKTQSPTL